MYAESHFPGNFRFCQVDNTKYLSIKKTHKIMASMIAQLAMEFAAYSCTLNLIPKNQMIEEINSCKLFSDLHTQTLCHACVHPINKMKLN